MLLDLFNQMVQDTFLSHEALSAKNKARAAELGSLRCAGAGLPTLDPNKALKDWQVKVDGLWMKLTDSRKGIIRSVCLPGDHGSIYIDAIEFIQAPDGTLFVPELNAKHKALLANVHRAGL